MVGPYVRKAGAHLPATDNQPGNGFWDQGVGGLGHSSYCSSVRGVWLNCHIARRELIGTDNVPESMPRQQKGGAGPNGPTG